MLAVIGGTGLTAFPGLEYVIKKKLSTPFGDPSGEVLLGQLQGHKIAFLPRHGHAHSIPPHRINYRANLWQLQRLGVSRVLAVNAVGGIHKAMGPGHLCIPDQLIDYTYGREHTFFDGSGVMAGKDSDGLTATSVEHVDFTSPYSGDLRQLLIQAMANLRFENTSTSGVYGCTQGPRLESAAEILRLQRDGCDMVGMTGMPEAGLARELKLNYASVCLVVNRGAGLSPEPITMTDIERVLEEGMGRVHKLIFESSRILASG